MSVRLFFSCSLLLLAACLLSAPAMAATPKAPGDYVAAWVDKQGWVYEGMQESDEPVPQREGEAWNPQDSSGLTALDYALLGASAQELGTVQNMVQMGARPGTGKAAASSRPLWRNGARPSARVARTRSCPTAPPLCCGRSCSTRMGRYCAP